MNKIDKNEELAIFYQYYHPLFKPEKQTIFELYYFEDYSINEIAELNHVSKNAIYNSLVLIEAQLHQYEEKLGLIKKTQYLDQQLAPFDVNVETLMKGYDE